MMALICTLLLAQGVAVAGTITFVDLTDTITLSDDMGERLVSLALVSRAL